MEYIPLILSTLVSICAIVATAYQTHSGRKTKINELYFSAQLEAYNNLFDIVAVYDVEPPQKMEYNYGPIIAAGMKAMLVSTHRNAEVIENFCAVYINYLEDVQKGKEPSKEILDTLKSAKFSMTTLLRGELLRFETMKRKSDKYFHYDPYEGYFDPEDEDSVENKK